MYHRSSMEHLVPLDFRTSSSRERPGDDELVEELKELKMRLAGIKERRHAQDYGMRTAMRNLEADVDWLIARVEHRRGRGTSRSK